MSTAIDVILFDLGGVLLDLNDPYDTFEMPRDGTDFHERWLLSDAVRALECGQLSVAEFVRKIVIEFELPYGEQRFLENFSRWPKCLFPEAISLLESLDGEANIALLSNTNAVHWERADIAGVLQPRFDQVFLSYRTGLLKPDREAYEAVIGHYGCSPASILFLDDNPLNVDGAKDVGIHALLTRGADELKNNLRAVGFNIE